jgi:hypothetical protein
MMSLSSTHLKKFNCPIVVWMDWLLRYGMAILSHRQNGSNRFFEYAFNFNL